MSEREERSGYAGAFFSISWFFMGKVLKNFILSLSFSENQVVGTQNLYLRKPDSLQKESAILDYSALRKRP